MKKVISCAAIFFVLTFQLSCQNKEANFICPPCDLTCDELTFEKDGICPHCKMNLIMNVSATAINEIKIKEGDGYFLIEGGVGHQEKTIKVFYVLSPQYSEKHYPQFWNYNLAGMLTDVKINEERTAMLDFKINDNPSDWIYNDFDRMFDLVKKELGLNSKKYDMFGHSAGGQVLHRLAIFKPNSKANRMLASNAGWYTVPDGNANFPMGLKNSTISLTDMVFSTKLVLFLGEKDNAGETRGDLRHTPELDKQGLHRLARAKYFYETSKRIASTTDKGFNWKLEIVSGVGHDYQEMSKVAAKYLYEKPKN